VTLLAALLAEREREVTDSLVDLLIATVHRIGARAERKVTEELIKAFRRVTGKENILFAIAEASLARPADAVREVVYPAVRGGEQTLRELVHEYKTKGPVYRRTVQTTLKASYTGHYRKGLIDLLGVLEFRSTNTAHQPVIEALRLIARYARAGNLTYYPAGETAPAHRGTIGEWADLVYRPDKHGRRRVVRMVYEVATFQALRDQLRCKEIWVAGAGRWRDPDEDLPKDFESRRAEHYASLRKPLDPAEFSGALREEMTAALAGLNDALPDLDWVGELTAYGCDKIFTDKASGKSAARPELDKALAYLREGDVFVITRLSRAMRSLKHLLALADDLRERGADLVVLKQHIDTTTPTGRLVFHILGAIDEFQRELIVEGTREGLQAARARGRTGGRKPKLNARQAATVRRMDQAAGPDGKRQHTVADIAEAVGVHRTTVYDYLKKED
jgi:DNA invertase Pin-like site-specific DNA recombinase